MLLLLVGVTPGTSLPAAPPSPVYRGLEARQALAFSTEVTTATLTIFALEDGLIPTPVGVITNNALATYLMNNPKGGPDTSYVIQRPTQVLIYR